MKTTAKTIGYNDGLRGTRRQAGRSANGFLSKPCNRFTMPIRWNAPIDEAEAAFRQLLKRLESRGEL